MKRLLIIFIISAILLVIIKLPIQEVCLLSLGIVLLYWLRVFILFVILAIILAIAGLSIKVAIMVAGGISLLYWVGTILFSDHYSQTWEYRWSRDFHENGGITIPRETYEKTANLYNESATDMFFGKKVGNKKKRNRNLSQQILEDSTNNKEKDSE